MRHVSFIRRAVIAATALSLLLPAVAQASPSGDSCAAYRIVPYVFPVPGSMRTPGTHHVQWHLTLTLPDGTPIDDVRHGSITIDPTAPSYPNSVNLGLDANVTLVDRDEVEVDAMQPDQAARFRLSVFGPKDWTAMLDSVRLRFSYEASPGVWSPEVELTPGPRASACSVLTFGFLNRSFGWAG
jgi:hypothetical protein